MPRVDYTSYSLEDIKRRTATTLKGCWEWIGPRQTPPLLCYGRLIYMEDGAKKQKMVHRAVWELVKGPIPQGMCVCHRCDNPPCCNPDHLFLGTRAENTMDRHLKGRSARGESHGAYTKPNKFQFIGEFNRTADRTGENNGRAKLNDKVVPDIKRLLSEGVSSVVEIAAKYGVSKHTIYRIKRQESWV